MDSIKKISENIASKCTRLAGLFLEVLTIEKGTAIVEAVNDEVTAAAFALDKYMTEGEYDYLPVLEYHLKASNRYSEALCDDIKNQIEYYLAYSDDSEEMARELSERIIYIQFRKKSAAWGEACPMIPLDLNLFTSPNAKPQYLLTTKGPESVLKILDFQIHKYNLPKEAPAESQEFPMTFHKFWINVALPLAILGYGITVVNIFINLSYLGAWAIVDLLGSGTSLVLAVMATMGLRSLERKAFVAHRWLLILGFIYSGFYAFLLMIVAPKSMIAHLVAIGSNILVYIYYKKREALFIN